MQDREIAEVIQSTEKVMEVVLNFISGAKTGIDACIDQSRLPVSMDNEQIRALIMSAHSRGLKLR